jgi:UDP-N-acetylmuramate dehydrogenase
MCTTYEYNSLSMQIQTDVSLKDYSTMRIGGTAKALTTVKSKKELTEAIAWAEERRLPTLVLGGGSNVIFSDGYDGLVIVNRIPGFEVVTDDAQSTTVCIGAGEKWDDAVKRTVDMNLHGIEFLSAIPGTAGGTPVQNVGAYGAQISDTLTELEAYDTETHRFTTLAKAECGFTYRNSMFKSPLDRHYIITSITLRLHKSLPQPPFYATLQNYLDQKNITDYTPANIRDAVVAIRAIKLPDPSVVANTGSFFKNPIIQAEQAHDLLFTYPEMAHWTLPDGNIKIAAGWLIEQAGLRGYTSHGMTTYERHALVLVNENAESYNDLAAFRQEIIDKIHNLFGITLEQEPELLP